MRTPICDFLSEYADSDAVRMHMPGHKGRGSTLEALDLTEIPGADSLFEANGIIRESEMIASEIFGARSFYSTEGSSLAIRAMVALISLKAKSEGKSPLILAARNAHKSFVSAAALVGCDVEWLYGNEKNYLSCTVDAADIELRLAAKDKPTAVYITSPDYLGAVADIARIADICHSAGVLLAVDNAHGAYLKFLSPSRHPIDLGADICSDSAHKTLPALTGAAYLHISNHAPKMLAECAKDVMAQFASTSPSYLIMHSLDALNKLLSNDFASKMQIFVCKIEDLKRKLHNFGYSVIGDEPMKIALRTKPVGYRGDELASILFESGITAEFADEDHLVLMPSPSNTDEDLERTLKALTGVALRAPILTEQPAAIRAERAMTLREAYLAPYEYLPLAECPGRILGALTVACPPAVPILMPGEVIDEDSVRVFAYYGTERLAVVKTV